MNLDLIASIFLWETIIFLGILELFVVLAIFSKMFGGT